MTHGKIKKKKKNIYTCTYYIAISAVLHDGILRGDNIFTPERSFRQCDLRFKPDNVNIRGSTSCTITVNKSKTNQEGTFEIRVLTCQCKKPWKHGMCSRPCALHALLDLLNNEHNPDSSARIFNCLAGNLMTAATFRIAMRKALQKIGIDGMFYGIHSLRIGGATDEAWDGVPIYEIMLHGYWSAQSRAFRSYVRGFNPDLLNQFNCGENGRTCAALPPSVVSLLEVKNKANGKKAYVEYYKDDEDANYDSDAPVIVDDLSALVDNLTISTNNSMAIQPTTQPKTKTKTKPKPKTKTKKTKNNKKNKNKSKNKKNKNKKKHQKNQNVNVDKTNDFQYVNISYIDLNDKDRDVDDTSIEGDRILEIVQKTKKPNPYVYQYIPPNVEK